MYLCNDFFNNTLKNLQNSPAADGYTPSQFKKEKKPNLANKNIE